LPTPSWLPYKPSSSPNRFVVQPKSRFQYREKRRSRRQGIERGEKKEEYIESNEFIFRRVWLTLPTGGIEVVWVFPIPRQATL
jgi:hypothetical protein